MKAVPLLAITNAVTLGLVILLYFQQDEPRGHQRASSSTQATIDEAALEARILSQLRREFAGNRPADVPGEVGDPARVKDDGSGTTNPATLLDPGKATKDPEKPILEGEYMESFRKNVRKALELNREEDRVNREMQRIDRLVSSNRIGALNDNQKRAVATTLLNARDKMPRVWRQFRDNPELRELPREDRAKLIRVEYQKLRDETQKELEEVIPAADAKTILDEGMRGGGDRGFGGPRMPRRTTGGSRGR